MNAYATTTYLRKEVARLEAANAVLKAAVERAIKWSDRKYNSSDEAELVEELRAAIARSEGEK